MIQRIQTVFLFLAAVIDFFVYFTPIYTRAIQDPAGWVGILFALLLAAAMLFSFYSIFLYKDRHNQIKWVKMAMWCQVAVFAVGTGILLTLGGIGAFLMREALSVLLILVALIALWQARRFIRKDQVLVDSMDRIR